MITLHDGVPVVKVIDFGIAKATNAELTTRTLFTQHNQMIGTPAYMSPEQAEMSGLDIDTRSDVYSLGVLLYELLTGTTPFATEELMGKGFAEMMRIIREEEPHKPSTRLSSLGASATQAARQRHTDVARLGTLLRGDLDWIVMKCLEKDRTRRYETANGLAADIRRHLSDEPVAAGPPSAAYRLSKFLKRHRVGVLASAAVAAVLVLGIVGTTTGMLRAIHQRERAELAESAMQHELSRATEVKRLITEMLGSINPMVAQGRDTTLLEGILDDTGQRLANGEIEDELIAAELHHVVGVAYRSIGSWDEADRHLPLALETRTRRLGKEDPATLQSKHEMLALGMYQRDSDRKSELEAMAVEILEARERVLGAEHPDTLTSLETMGTIFGTFGRPSDAEPIIAKALDARMRVLGPEHRDTLESLAHMGFVYLKLGRLAEAEPRLVASEKTRTRVLGENHPDTLVSVGNLFVLYEMQGRHEESLPLRLRSVEIAEKVLGNRHPFTPGIRLGLGSLYAILGRHANAVSVYEDDLRKRRQLDHVEIASGAPGSIEVFEVYSRDSSSNGAFRAMRNLATSYDRIERRADALALYRELLEHLPSEADDDRAGPFALFMVAWVLTRDHPEVSDPARAVDFARGAVDRTRATSRNYHMFLDTFALALHQVGATAEAIEAERQAIASIPEIEPNPTDARTDETVRAGYEARLRIYEDSMSGGQVSPP
jgi:tetratricopeptide (TPR) repeat protein